MSLESGVVPQLLKSAVITPLLKKPTHDPDHFSNYRPISNLPLLFKIMEKVIAPQLLSHLSSSHLYEVFQSGFRSRHSTETALVRVTNYILISADSGSPRVLALLDFSSALHRVDPNIVLWRLKLHWP